ncbi:MAG: hypothetical protein AUK47_17425 [Deltaproteobacteria bacterium CG2_30_63_29]|nr:MAG: hypothetical protein AUK47_17425 [Deltaproteobacteria bacterium CG2_30_63_29]PIW01858.1 MAG: hypothetical protein COW42_03530 [Deltaproteobacteria bacterium CG17_big_fil_post_rev_8_21_14_2_50_63_7]PJB35506.1 MAG: hypothetical protein CO108_25475 [Deltaproteobacteria bacterium CG_4_9_14_3_um_filter_63_12]
MEMKFSTRSISMRPVIFCRSSELQEEFGRGTPLDPRRKSSNSMSALLDWVAGAHIASPLIRTLDLW